VTSEEQEDQTIYEVVVNDEEQYSIWPADRDAPLGWRGIAKSGTKKECLRLIGELWTDMRPLSLRQAAVPKRRSKTEKPAPRKQTRRRSN
jgi:MbtH protein